MDKKPFTVTEEERVLLEQLRGQPKLEAAVRGVLDAAKREDCVADEVESELIEATRVLGREAMCSWGERKARGVEEEMEEEKEARHRHKKKC